MIVWTAHANRLVRALLPIAVLLVSAPGAAATALPRQQDFPAFTLSRSSGPVGTRVDFTGQADLSISSLAQWRHPGYFNLIGNGPDVPCELVVDLVNPVIHVDAAGRVNGSFVVGPTGRCFQGHPDEAAHPTVPARYELAILSHPCSVATFRVTATTSSTLPFTGAGESLTWMAGASVGLIGIGVWLTTLSRRRVRR